MADEDNVTDFAAIEKIALGLCGKGESGQALDFIELKNLQHYMTPEEKAALKAKLLKIHRMPGSQQGTGTNAKIISMRRPPGPDPEDLFTKL